MWHSSSAPTFAYTKTRTFSALSRSHRLSSKTELIDSSHKKWRNDINSCLSCVHITTVSCLLRKRCTVCSVTIQTRCSQDLNVHWSENGAHIYRPQHRRCGAKAVRLTFQEKCAILYSPWDGCRKHAPNFNYSYGYSIHTKFYAMCTICYGYVLYLYPFYPRIYTMLHAHGIAILSMWSSNKGGSNMVLIHIIMLYCRRVPSISHISEAQTVYFQSVFSFFSVFSSHHRAWEFIIVFYP